MSSAIHSLVPSHAQPAADSNDDAEPRFLDPVWATIMSDPVVCSDGRTYDRSTAARLKVSPFTREPFSVLVDNVALRGDIFERYPKVAAQYRNARELAAPANAVTPPLPPPYRQQPAVPVQPQTSWTEGARFKRQGGPNEGIWYYPNGDQFVGTMKNGVPEGRGKLFVKANQATYAGCFVSGKLDGSGSVAGQFGRVEYRYNGFFKNGRRHGHGREVINCRPYEVEYREDLRISSEFGRERSFIEILVGLPRIPVVKI